MSLRKAESDLSIPYSTIHKILKRLIHMVPYKIPKVQHLPEDDKINRVEFAQWCKDIMSMSYSFLHRIIFSDECVFHVSGIANTQNTRILETENPQEAQQHEMHGEKLTVWCAINSQGVLDSYYFDNETVGKKDYCELLDSYVRAEA